MRTKTRPKYIRTAEINRFLPKAVTPKTISMWIGEGVCGVRLKVIHLHGWWTKPEWIEEFLQQVSAAKVRARGRKQFALAC